MLGKGQNYNHPKKGSNITVEPIRSITHIQQIIKLLKNKKRDKLLFLMGINNGVRTGDLLKLRVCDVRCLRQGQFVGIKESKTQKKNFIFINDVVYEALQDYFKTCKPKAKDWLFPTRKSGNPLSIQAVNAKVKIWGKKVGITENLGAHSLRKTWGYHQRLSYGTPIELITKRFKHSSTSVTLLYLGIQEPEVLKIMQNNIGETPSPSPSQEVANG